MLKGVFASIETDAPDKCNNELKLEIYNKSLLLWFYQNKELFVGKQF